MPHNHSYFEIVLKTVEEFQKDKDILKWQHLDLDFSTPFHAKDNLIGLIKNNIGNHAGIYAIFNTTNCLYIGVGRPIWTRLKAHYYASQGKEKSKKWSDFFQKHQTKLKIYWKTFTCTEDVKINDHVRSLLEAILTKQYKPLFEYQQTMHKILTTKRLHLRPMDVQDAHFMLKLVNSPGWLRFIGDRNINSQADAEQYIRKIIDTPQYFHHVFSLKSTAEPVGIVTFLHRENQKYPDIGFAILPEFQKQSLAFEAAQKYLAELMLAKPSYQKIIGITLPDNLSSIALLEKLGLKFEFHYTENNELLSQYGIAF